ncbi:MAG: DUF1015 family protein [Chitinophagales bacterium]|nr:DUF1015 family protein [Chitinophagales bacterium]MDW8428425.1 DUF1015 family protein [Chitinophagales bacterium]
MRIRPFRGFRPLPQLAARVALVPNGLLSDARRRRAARNNPYSFAHVVKPKIDFPDDVPRADDQLYAFARQYFDKMVQEGIFLRDSTPCFYLYRSILPSHTQTGLICCLDIEDYDQHRVRRHENTRQDKELANERQITLTQLNSYPVFLTHRPVEAIDQFLTQLAVQPPAYDFECESGWQQQLWVISNSEAIEQLIQMYELHVPVSYIADGHHRCAAASRFAATMRQRDQGQYLSRDHQFFLAALFSSNQLRIYDYNRIVKTLNGLDAPTFLQRVAERFEVSPAPRRPFRPTCPEEIGMFFDQTWYVLRVRPQWMPQDMVSRLSASLLQDLLLEPVLGIIDPRSSKELDFVPGIQGLKELERRVAKGKAAAAFSLFPVSMEQLMAVSDANRIMPPKSTWFEPKLLSGLVVFKMEY